MLTCLISNALPFISGCCSSVCSIASAVSHTSAESFFIGTPHTRQGEERGVREVGDKGGGGRWCVRARTVLARGDHVVDHRVRLDGEEGGHSSSTRLPREREPRGVEGQIVMRDGPRRRTARTARTTAAPSYPALASDDPTRIESPRAPWSLFQPHEISRRPPHGAAHAPRAARKLPTPPSSPPSPPPP